MQVEGQGVAICPSCGHINDIPGQTSDVIATPKTWTVTAKNGNEYPYEGGKPAIGQKVKIVLPGKDVYVKVTKVS